MTRSLLLISLGLGLTSGLAAAQGSNSCSTPTPISGTGIFAFDNTGATSTPTNCPVGSDVWFAWTAPATDQFSISTCGLAGFDTYLAAYAGTACPPGASIACNDDSCGLQSTIFFGATAGQTYLLEVGGFSASQGTGSIEVLQGQSGGCANPATGPDVIVGDVSGCSTYGAIGGVSAYSLGTTSCNTGTAELNWIASTPQHPVIGQNIYRLNDGRFEQLGQSWLKHGFTALQQSLCCQCISSGTGSRLGVGCSDPYGSGLNGSQSGLGPRSEVNAYTGVFQYPYGFQGQSGDTIYKRCQVPTADVDPANFPSATYFGEAQYVAPDDAQAGNGKNNVSWRPLDRSSSTQGGAFRLSTTSTTRREEPAMMAWKEAVPDVDVVAVDIPNEGRIWVASHCFQDVNGYRYEYCVMNLDSHRSVRSFTIPTGTGTPITNIGMSFPLSHSGEPFDNLSWTGQYLGDRIEWATDDFGVNPDANAIRWGTMYSFWFVSTSPPEPKSAILGLFRPGPQLDPTVGVCGPSGGGGQPFVSNYCTPTLNSTGVTGEIDAQNIDLNARTMELTASNLPTNAFAYSLASLTQDFIMNPGTASGHLCVGGNIGRAVGGAILNTGATGTLLEGVDLDSVPQPMGSVAVQPGDTWYFQYWHRDVISGLGLSTSNFTNGVRVLFP